MRGADREEAEPARRRRGDRQLRDRAGDRPLRPDVPVEELVAAVESAGYGAHPASRPTKRARRRSARADHQHHDEPLRVLTPPAARRRRSDRPGRAAGDGAAASQFAGWEWLALVLSTPVVFYSGIGFHRAALRNARHVAATMDTLISLGTSPPGSGRRSCSSAGSTTDTYFEVGAVVTTLILLGRYLEARAKGRSSEAIRKLLELGAKEARRAARRPGGPRPRRPAAGRRPVRRPPRREDRHRRRRRRGRVGGRPVDADRREACRSRSRPAWTSPARP